MSSAYPYALKPGTRIDTFEITQVLGVGGFGVTYKAFDHKLQCDVAIKEYLPEGLAHRALDGVTLTPNSAGSVNDFEYGLTRFLQEARTLAKFHEPSIVRVTQYIVAHGTAYLVMDYERGETLAQRLRREHTLDEETINRILVPILFGLRAVHAKRYLHRDMKPGNIFLRDEGPPFLLDFGAARQALGHQSHALTMLVTPGYAAFEQYHTTDRQGPWTDLYGLGATLYHCVTGFAPPAATERIELMHDGSEDPIRPVLQLASKRYSPELSTNIEWMISPYPKNRPQSVDEVLEAMGVEVPPTGAPERGDAPGNPTGQPAGRPVEAAQEVDSAWEADTLEALTAHLEHEIGPMARSLVRKAAVKTRGVEEISELLARFIHSEESKTQFLNRTRDMGRVTEEMDLVLDEPEPEAEATAAGSLDAQDLERAEQALSHYLGPVARLVVRKRAGQAKGIEELWQALAGELVDESERAAFLRDLRR
jgi:serine/threonine protein kinase